MTKRLEQSTLIREFYWKGYKVKEIHEKGKHSNRFDIYSGKHQIGFLFKQYGYYSFKPFVFQPFNTFNKYDLQIIADLIEEVSK